MKLLTHYGQRFYTHFAAQDPLDLITRLTLLVIVLSDWVVGEDWRFKAPLRLIALIGLLVPPLHRHRLLWLGLALIFSAMSWTHWWTQDNHIFLLTYWCLALCIAFFSQQNPSALVATNARLLIGLSFAFAVLWKGILSPDFMDGTYFHYTFLTDNRFQDFGLLFGDMKYADFAYNRQRLARLGNANAAIEFLNLRSSDQLALLATVITWWTLFIEGALAVLFLWPGETGPARYRHGALLVFAWTTYLIATVETFGWTLLTLGAAQCLPDQHRLRLLYMLSCLLILLYHYVPLMLLLRLFVAD